MAIIFNKFALLLLCQPCIQFYLLHYRWRLARASLQKRSGKYQSVNLIYAACGPLHSEGLSLPLGLGRKANIGEYHYPSLHNRRLSVGWARSATTRAGEKVERALFLFFRPRVFSRFALTQRSSACWAGYHYPYPRVHRGKTQCAWVKNWAFGQLRISGYVMKSYVNR